MHSSHPTFCVQSLLALKGGTDRAISEYMELQLNGCYSSVHDNGFARNADKIDLTTVILWQFRVFMFN